MIELIVKLAIYVSITVALISLIAAIPEIAAMFSILTDSTYEFTNAINSFVMLLQSYITPWLGLLNNILSPTIKDLLIAYIVWIMMRKIIYFLIDGMYGITRNLIEKIS